MTADRSAGVARPAAARNDGETERDELAHHGGNLLLGVGRQHQERVFHAPVGRVGNVRDAGKTIEQDVVPARHARKAAQCARAQCTRRGEFVFEALDCLARKLRQTRHFFASRASGFDFLQPAPHAGEEIAAPLGTPHQLVLEIRIALDGPHLAEHFVEHARRATGAPLGAQVANELPGLLAQQPQHDLAVGEGGVVVRNLANPAHWRSTPKTSR
jgi:hypothetical protein